MSIGAAVASFEYDGPQDQPDRHARATRASSPTRSAALRVVDAAVVVVNAVMGVEVHTERLWARADEEGLARLVFVNMLDRERADFFRTPRLAEGGLRPPRRRDRDPDRLRARGARGDRPDRHEGVRVRGRGAGQRRARSRSPRTCGRRPRSTARS